MQPLNVMLAISGAAGVAAGMELVIMPESMPGKSSRLRQWLFERDLLALFNRPRRMERSLYRHHRIWGALVIVGALTLLALLDKLDANLYLVIGALGNVGAVTALTVWALAVFALIVGIYLFIRPSALKGFEAIANRWIELFPRTAQNLPPYQGVNRLILRMPRQTGILLVLAGVSLLWIAAT